MKKISLLFIILLIITTTEMKSQEKEIFVNIETSAGTIKIKLYNETPVHRDNFIKLVEDNFYRNRIFHRVIKNFMIQAGEPLDKSLANNEMANDKIETIPAEIKFPKLYHKRGALAAARTADNVNPTKASSPYQFYIVTGDTINDTKMKDIERMRFEKVKQQAFNKLRSENSDIIKSLYKDGNQKGLSELQQSFIDQAEAEATTVSMLLKYSPQQIEVYKTIGGTPFLDNEYTVFGEVVEGMDIVDKIQNTPTAAMDRPVEPIIIKDCIIEN